MYKSIYYFLGSNTGSGFYSLYDKFTLEKNVESIYIIKGGPGCGKSSFMRSIAAALKDEGMVIEYMLNPMDPDSLDGIFIPSLKTAYLDGTEPHILEPRYPGIREAYVNLGIFYDSKSLIPQLEKVAECMAEYEEYYEKACHALKAAEVYQIGMFDKLFDKTAYQTIARRSEGVIFRELKKTGRPAGKPSVRFLNTLGPTGCTCLFSTAATLCERLYVIDNTFSLAPLFIAPICDSAIKKGYDVVICASPLNPAIIEHLLIPELSLGFISAAKGLPYNGDAFKHVRLDALANKEMLRKFRKHYRSEIALRDALLNKACGFMLEAKEVNDRMEAIYNPNVDFGGVYALAEAHIKALLQKQRP
ncbi:MAG: hypothetical protein GX111_00910 [Clostridiales bacterium]|jgi:energy-coupling factor transporter ATP-binding protein EcfA2|nr:hypothetical protein [Clostridiales bacterium]